MILRIFSGILAITAVFALPEALIHAHVVSSWGVVWHWIGRWWLMSVVVLLVVAAVIAWRQSRGPITWTKELTVAIIAALAVLVSGAVTAFVSWTTASRTLQEQRSLSSESYFRDTKKALYFDIIAKAGELGRSLDQIPLAAVEVEEGKSPQISISIQNDLAKKRDNYQYTIEPAFIVAPPDTAGKAKAVADEASVILDAVIRLNCAVKYDLACGPFHQADPNTVKNLAQQLANYVTKGKWGTLLGELLKLMRDNLGITAT
ncbi:hypothetical protein [Mycobacterium arosiense]|uniref:hypothetical protein n=1 Tax=Mycobacterium arosiense TaxID=425468 RepID=UPI001154F55C|nr:hypothetical protein [Mycobacterium arosiense]